MGVGMRKPIRTIALLALLLGLTAGLYGRIDGFGLRPLAVDEYYFVQSIGFILDHGIPSFPSGGFYGRGPLLQYVTAAGTLSESSGSAPNRIRSGCRSRSKRSAMTPTTVWA